MTGNRDLQAVLWDMDGTIVDTEPYWQREEFRLVERHGGSWSTADAHLLVGHDLLTSAQYIREHGPVDLEPEQIVDELLDGVVEQMRGEVPWRPGARELLAALAAAHVPSALVTMSYRRLAEALLDALPPRSFAVSITGDEVDNGKPHPEPYLAAAAALGVDPRLCVAIEDSPTGVASALAAGCAVVGVPHVVPLPESPGLVQVGSLESVDVPLLERLVGGATVTR